MAELRKDLWAQDDEEEIYRNTLRGERALIGAMIRDNGLMKHATEYLLPDSFNVRQHRAVFAAMAELNKRRTAITTEGITSELRSQGKLKLAGGEDYVASLDKDVPRALTIERPDYVDRFVLATIGIAGQAAALSETMNAEDVARLLLEKIQKYKALKGWEQKPLLRGDEDPVN